MDGWRGVGHSFLLSFPHTHAHAPLSPFPAVINAAIAGCVTGAVSGWSAGPATAASNCALFAGGSLLFDRLGAGGSAKAAGGAGPRLAARRAGKGRSSGRAHAPPRSCGPAGCPAVPPLAAALAALPPGVAQFLVKRPDLFAAAAHRV